MITNIATLESPDASIHVSNTVQTTIIGALPDTGHGPVSTGSGPPRVAPGWLLVAMLLAGALLLLALRQRRRT